MLARLIEVSFQPERVPALAPQVGLSMVAAVIASLIENPLVTVAGTIRVFWDPE